MDKSARSPEHQGFKSKSKPPTQTTHLGVPEHIVLRGGGGGRNTLTGWRPVPPQGQFHNPSSVARLVLSVQQNTPDSVRHAYVCLLHYGVYLFIYCFID